MQKIDLVYLWVDGNDPKWRREKTKYLNLSGGKKINQKMQLWPPVGVTTMN